jgi:uncharacterized protein
VEPRPPANWYRDPGGTHEFRYWDGERWTDGVATGGVVSEVALPEGGPPAPTEERHRWSGWIALIALGAALLCIVAQAVLYGVGDLVGGDLLAFLLAEVGLYGGFYLTCWIVSRKRGTGSVRRDFALRYEKGDWYRGLATSFLARLAAVVVSVVLITISEELAGTNTEVFEEYDEQWALIVLFAVSALVFAPFFEELFFRGLIQRSLENVLPVPAAIGLQAGIFGLFHLGGAEGAGNVGVIAATAAAGVLFGVVARKYDRLGPGIAGHAWFNLLPVVVLLVDR